jgi:hypothetical protein
MLYKKILGERGEERGGGRKKYSNQFDKGNRVEH